VTIGNCTLEQGCYTQNRDCTDAPGCETFIDEDPMNCGGCGQNCSYILHSDPYCQSGVCTLDICDPGYDNCDDNGNNGCESDLSSIYTCTGCGTDCTQAPYAYTVLNVTCNVTCSYDRCSFGYLDCDGFPDDYCEVSMDEFNCGTCGTQCALQNAYPYCDVSLGACTTGGGCYDGFGDCNNDASDGCETDLSSSDANCGTCNSPCEELSNPHCQDSECVNND